MMRHDGRWLWVVGLLVGSTGLAADGSAGEKQGSQAAGEDASKQGEALHPELEAISAMLAEGRPTSEIEEAWKAYVTKQAQAEPRLDVAGTVQRVQRRAEAKVKAETQAQKARLEARVQAGGEDAQLANVDLQNALRAEEQRLQQVAETSRMLHDTALAIIR